MKKKRTFIRAAKYYLYKYKIYRILPSNKLNFAGHLSAVSKWISQHQELEFSSFPNKNFNYSNRLELYKYVLDNMVANEEIDYFEFGVAKGDSFRWWVEHKREKGTSFYGFDTFTGLPEDWGDFKKGDMSSGNAPPQIDDLRHKFYQGLFQTTLYDFLENYDSTKKKIIHLDADLYSATLFVLTTFSPYLRKGDILIFDEFNVPLHEFKAFIEWVNSYYVDYKVIGEVNNYLQVIIRIEKNVS